MKKAILTLIGLANTAQAYTNDTMSDAYRSLVYNMPVDALRLAYVEQLGEWFYLLLAAGPWAGLWLYQRDSHIPTIWLTCVLAAYSGLLVGGTLPNHVFYLVAVMWVATVLYKAFSPAYTN